MLAIINALIKFCVLVDVISHIYDIRCYARECSEGTEKLNQQTTELLKRIKEIERLVRIEVSRNENNKK